jgi:hypothetical protein
VSGAPTKAGSKPTGGRGAGSLDVGRVAAVQAAQEAEKENLDHASPTTSPGRRFKSPSPLPQKPRLDLFRHRSFRPPPANCVISATRLKDVLMMNDERK